MIDVKETLNSAAERMEMAAMYLDVYKRQLQRYIIIMENRLKRQKKCGNLKKLRFFQKKVPKNFVG